MGINPQEDQTVDSVISLLPEPFDKVVEAAKLFFEFIDYYRVSDPLGQAVQLIQQEIQKIEQDLQYVNARLNALTTKIAQIDNTNRWRTLENYNRQIASLAFRLSQHPADTGERASIAFDAGNLVDEFLNDPDLWNWTDVQTTIERDEFGNPVGPPVVSLLNPDFKSHLALPIYTFAVMTWLVAIDLDTGGNYVSVQNTYGDKLRHHIANVSTRPDWNELEQPPQTFPENIKARITCYPLAQNTYAQNGECTFAILCKNVMDRKTTSIRDVIVPITGPQFPPVLCTADPNLGVMDERQIEDDNGVRVLAAIEEALRRVETTGTLREPFIGKFNTTPFYNTAFIYAVKPNGELLWFKQQPSGSPSVPSGWDGPQTVGNGWGDFLNILPAGGSSLYAIQLDGTLLWYEHEGFNDGSLQWKGPVKVGIGWNVFSAIVAGGDGVLYTVRPDGTLLWYRHDGFRNGGGIDTWRGPIPIGNGWNKFKRSFSTGKGVLYAVAGDGTLLWYHHKGFENGEAMWEGPTPVGKAWQNFSNIFSAGDGIIYAVQPDGTLLWYKHEAWETGFPDEEIVGVGLQTHLQHDPWQGPITAGSGWTGYRNLFALLPAASEQPH